MISDLRKNYLILYDASRLRHVIWNLMCYGYGLNMDLTWYDSEYDPIWFDDVLQTANEASLHYDYNRQTMIW